MATNSKAHTSELIDRLATSTMRASRFKVLLRVRLAATSKPKGTASTTDSKVPKVAICSVSTSAACTPSE